MYIWQGLLVLREERSQVIRSGDISNYHYYRPAFHLIALGFLLRTGTICQKSFGWYRVHKTLITLVLHNRSRLANRSIKLVISSDILLQPSVFFRLNNTGYLR
jgi:hypothetical protein